MTGDAARRILELGQAFDKETADRLAARFEWHYTPPHGSWLNRAECNNVLVRRCLNRHFPEQAQVAVWCRYRNGNSKPIQWPWTTADVRIQLYSTT